MLNCQIDVFDIEIDATDPDEVVRALAPTFGGINLEGIVNVVAVAVVNAQNR